MRRFLATLVALVLSAIVCHAQHIGDIMDAVRKVRGEPQMKRASGSESVWIYADGAKLTFKDGAVTRVAGVSESAVIEVQNSAPSAAPVSSSTATTRTENRVSAPTQKKAVNSSAGKTTSSKTSSGAEVSSVRSFLAVALFVVVVITSVICNILILIEAFRASVWWGLGCMFVPLVGLLFVVSHWAETRKPFATNLLTTVCGLGAAFSIVGI